MNCDGYGRLLPLRTLEEVRFWKEQEKEHTLLIRTLVPNLEPSYVKLLEEWEAAFANSERAANQLIKQLLPATQPPAPISCEVLINSSGRHSSSPESLSNSFILCWSKVRRCVRFPLLKPSFCISSANQSIFWGY